MLADALAQFLLARKWPNVLVLRGPLPEDKENADAFAHAAKRFGLSVAATRDFIVSNDPRHRDQDNIALLTGDASYDVVYIADSDGNFARRSLPYATNSSAPRHRLQPGWSRPRGHGPGSGSARRKSAIASRNAPGAT